jgi:hypothetical protein
MVPTELAQGKHGEDWSIFMGSYQYFMDYYGKIGKEIGIQFEGPLSTLFPNTNGKQTLWQSAGEKLLINAVGDFFTNSDGCG